MKFYNAEIISKLKVLNESFTILNENKTLKPIERTKVELAFVESSSWFVFYNIELLYDKKQCIYKVNYSSIDKNSIIPDQHESYIKILFTIFNRDGQSLEYIQLKTILEELGYTFAISEGKLCIVLERVKFNYGKM